VVEINVPRSQVIGISWKDEDYVRGDLIETFKILTGKEHVNCSKFFELADVTSGLRGHSLKLFKPRCHTTVTDRTSVCELPTSGTSYHRTSWVHAPSIDTFKNRLNRHWYDMGIII